MIFRSQLVLLALVPLFAAACGDSSDAGPSETPAPSGPSAAPDLVTSGSPVERAIGAEGGELVLSTPAGDWRLEIPAGSLATEQTISMTAATVEGAPGLHAVALEPSGLTFAQGAILHFSGVTRPTPALSFEPGGEGVELTYASADASGARFVLQHFSAGALQEPGEPLGSAGTALTDAQRADAAAFDRLNDQDVDAEQQGVALGEEFHRALEPLLAAAGTSVPRFQQATTAFFAFGRRIDEAEAGSTCDSIRCLRGEACRSDESCGAGRCEAGACVRTLSVLSAQARERLVVAGTALKGATTAPACEHRGANAIARPTDWVELPALVDSLLGLLGATVPGLPCASATVLVTGPAALGSAREVPITLQALVTTPSGVVEAPGTFAVGVTGASVVGGDSVTSADGAAVSVTIDRGEPAAATLLVEVSAQLVAPWRSLGNASGSLRLNASPITLEIEATPTRITTAGGTAELCVRMLADGVAVPNWNVREVALDGPGSTVNGSAGTATGEQVCGIVYTAPNPLPEGGGVATISLTARNVQTGEEGSGSVDVELGGSALAFTLTATPQTLTRAGETATICASLVDAEVPVSRWAMALAFAGPGQLERLETTLVDVTTPDCQLYTAPTPLPAGVTSVRIDGTGTADGRSAAGFVALSLEPSAGPLVFSGTFAALHSDGGSFNSEVSLTGTFTVADEGAQWRLLSADGLSAGYRSTDGVARPGCENFNVVEVVGGGAPVRILTDDDTAVPLGFSRFVLVDVPSTIVETFRDDGSATCDVRVSTREDQVGVTVLLELRAGQLFGTLLEPTVGLELPAGAL